MTKQAQRVLVFKTSTMCMKLNPNLNDNTLQPNMDTQNYHMRKLTPIFDVTSHLSDLYD